MSSDGRNDRATDVPTIIDAIQRGEMQAAEDLLPLVYDELRKLARARMAHLPPGQTIQATALVHEAYLKLVRDQDPGWNGRGHFFGAAAQAMREILVDHARHRSRLKRGAGRRAASLDDGPAPSIELEVPCDDLLRLDVALDRLKVDHERTMEVVLLRQFAGLNNPTIAEVMGVSVHVVEREWRFARAWLHRELNEPPSPDDESAPA